MNILGISAYYHDGAACLLSGGIIRAAAHEERFTRIKNDRSFPLHAVKYCLSSLKLGERIDAIAFYDNFALKRMRSLRSFAEYGGISSFIVSLGNWAKLDDFWAKIGKLGLNYLDCKTDIFFIRHHLSHAASAFFCSPFKEASIVTVDGVGEFDTTTIGEGSGTKLRLLKSIEYPHSLGLFYSAFTLHLGFKVNSGEYKVMGLAPLGEPTMVKNLLDHIIEPREDGSFKLNLDIFSFHRSRKMIDHEKVEALLGVPARPPEAPLDKKHRDLAASIQLIIEQVIEGLAREAVHTTGKSDLCFAGGVALNCSALGKLRNKISGQIYVQPAAGDAGGALGAALALWNSRAVAPMSPAFSCYLGPSIDNARAEAFFIARGFPFTKFDNIEGLSQAAAEHLRNGHDIGWCRGPMEWGPRALGSRSIIASPLKPNIKQDLNLRTKKRESFRPFAPIVLEEFLSDLFINPAPSPTMSFVFFLREQLRDPHAQLVTGNRSLSAEQFLYIKDAVIHADWSARIQSVSHDSPVYPLLRHYYDLTGCPLLINTSMNVRGEPIVLDHWDAYKCFWRAELDYLVVGNMLLQRLRQPILPEEELDEFDPD